MSVRQPVLRRPRISPEEAKRLPPGQHLTRRWPVLHHGEVPPFDPERWDFQISGLVATPLRFDWPAFSALPTGEVTADLHCVTRWSTLDNHWHGVSARDVIRQAGPEPAARFAILHADGGYTANLPLAALLEDDAILATGHNGGILTPDHGFPLRAIVPSRYAWKSVKWLRGIELVADDRPGFWEGFGYHANADPWREERFAE